MDPSVLLNQERFLKKTDQKPIKTKQRILLDTAFIIISFNTCDIVLVHEKTLFLLEQVNVLRDRKKIQVHQ